MPIARHTFAGQDVLVPQAPVHQSATWAIPTLASPPVSVPQPPCCQESDLRDDAAMQRTLFCLQELFKENREVLVGLSQLQFGDYLREPCYAAAAAQLPPPAPLPPTLPKKWKKGDFDILLIHRQYGFVVCEVKSVGSYFKDINQSKQEEEDIIKSKMNQAVSQLNKAETTLLHLVSDVSPNLRITKTIVVPNLTAHQLQQAISSDSDLTQVSIQVSFIRLGDSTLQKSFGYSILTTCFSTPPPTHFTPASREAYIKSSKSHSTHFHLTA